jgi:hypothetical protein
MPLSSIQFARTTGNRRFREHCEQAIAIGVGVASLAVLLVALLGMRAAVPQASMPEPAPLSAPAPLGATVTTAADFPEQSQIAACWSLANRSNALVAPRSNQASNVVGPIYGDACQGA